MYNELKNLVKETLLSTQFDMETNASSFAKLKAKNYFSRPAHEGLMLMDGFDYFYKHP